MDFSERKLGEQPPHSDLEWVQGLKKKDPQVIADLWQQLHLYAYKLIKYEQANVDDANSAALKAYENVMERGLAKYNFRGKFLAYCKIIVVNAHRDIGRRVRNDPTQTQTLELEDELIGEAVIAFPALSNTAVWRKIAPCFVTLTKLEQRVMVALYLRMLSPAATALRVDETRNYVNQLANRGRKKLKACLVGKGYRSVDDIL